MKKILIIDTKAGNLFSLQAAIGRLGFETKVLIEPNNESFDGIVIPGQGRFGTVLDNIRQNNWVEYLEKARETGTPILGICVGMQIFFEASDEDSNTKGIGWFTGKAKALNFPKKPMVGWATLTSDTWPQATVYFVNSYAIKNADFTIAETTYGEKFCAAIRKDNFTGVQFHPEKSSQAGIQIIRDALGSSGENS